MHMYIEKLIFIVSLCRSLIVNHCLFCFDILMSLVNGYMCFLYDFCDGSEMLDLI